MYKIVIKDEDDNIIKEFKTKNAIIGTDKDYSIMGEINNYNYILSILDKLIEIIVLSSLFDKNYSKTYTFNRIKEETDDIELLKTREREINAGLDFVFSNITKRLKKEFYNEAISFPKNFKTKVYNKSGICLSSQDTDNALISTDSGVIFYNDRFDNVEDYTNELFTLLSNSIEYLAFSLVAQELGIDMKEVDNRINKADREIYNKIRESFKSIFNNVIDNYKMFFIEKRLNNGEKYVVDEDYAFNYLMARKADDFMKNLGLHDNDDNDNDDDDDDYDDPTESKFFS